MNSRKQRLVRFGALMGITVAALAVFVGGGVDDPAIFELEGNAVNDAAPGDDWANVNSGGGSSKAHTGLVTDLITSGDNIFTGGGSKDGNDISAWDSRTGAPPDKDDIEHVYAAAYTLPNTDTAIYFGADRYDNSGDAQIGFWFLQGSISYNSATGKFGGTPGPDGKLHRVGDLLIVAHFVTGGAVPEIEVFRWTGSDIALVVPSNTAGCDPSTGSAEMCAIVNGTTATAPWSFVDKSGNTDFAPGEFFEGALNLSALARQLNVPVPCFATFMAETRASAKPDSVLKDFVPPAAFPLCGVSVTKACPSGSVNPTGDAYTYKFGGTVTNTGIGILHNVTVTDTFPLDATQISPAGNGSGNVRSYNVGSLAAGECKRWPNGEACTAPPPSTVFGTFQSVTNGPQNSASAAAAVDSAADAPKDVTAGPAQATCPSITGSPAISVSKSCSTTVSTGLAVTVNFTGEVCNQSNFLVTGVTASDQQTNPAGGTVIGPGGTVVFSGGSPVNLAVCPTPGSCTSANSPNSCRSFSGSYTPSQVSSGTDACSYTFNDKVSASGTVPLLSQSVSNTSNVANCKLCPCSP